MKIFWLTVPQFGYAVIVGLLFSLVIIYGMAPHPVEVPLQVITPVPTSPPVIIGSQYVGNSDVMIIVQQMISFMPLMIAMGVILGVIMSILNMGRDKDDEYRY